MSKNISGFQDYRHYNDLKLKTEEFIPECIQVRWGKMKATTTGIKRYLKIGVLSASLLLLTVVYQNCGQKTTEFEEMSSFSSFSALSSEDDLFTMLQEARDLAALLKTYDLSADPNSPVLKEAPSLANALLDKADLIERAITIDKIPTNSNVVLKEVDSLVNLLAQGRDVRVAYDSIRRDKLLATKIDQLEATLTAAIKQLTELGGAFDAFKTAINARVDGLVVQMKKWEDRVDVINKAIADLAAKGAAEDLALKAALQELKKYTENELTGVKERSTKLEADVKKQAEDAKKIAEDLLKAQEEMSKLSAISGRLCLYNDAGQINDTRPRCTSSTQTGSCCLTADVIDCGALFPAATAPAALNQCSLLLTVLKNHDQQLQAIKAIDERQDAALNKINSSIDGILKDITTLNNNVSTLAGGLEKIKAVTDELANQVSSIKDTMKKNDDAIKARLADLDTRVMLLEFKANRAEVISGLQARSNATLAWATHRYAQINSQFCSARRNQALAMFDYRTTRQNLEYCYEKRAFAVLAQSMAHVANGYAGLLGSLNVDTDCSVTINGKVASSLTNSELLDDTVVKELTTKCTSGGQVVARALMLNIVRYLKQIGPDFRTYASMSSTSNAVNIAFFGKEWAQVALADQKAFDDVDPTGEQWKNTPFGEVERPFIYNYYSTAFRDAYGKFIADPTKVNVNVSGAVYTEKQLLDGAQVGKNMADYVKRVRALEAEGYCQDCGFKITGRANPDSNRSSLVISHGPDKKRFFYPNDPREGLCPVDDDVVIRHADGKHYVYHLSFDTWGNDILTPVLTRGLPTVIANSDADLSSGNFASCGYERDVQVERAGMDMASIPTRLTIRATRPYAAAYGRPLCTKLTAVCAVKQSDWEAPASLGLTIASLQDPATQPKLARYLTGFPAPVINAMCSVQLPTVGAPAPVYYNQRNIASSEVTRGLKSAWSQPTSANASGRAQQYVAVNATQLIGTSYWPFQDGPLPYTAERIMFSQSNAFANQLASAAPLSTTNYIREADPVDSLYVQECSHCPANLKMLGGCGTPPAQ
jgi:hypothetical protein